MLFAQQGLDNAMFWVVVINTFFAGLGTIIGLVLKRDIKENTAETTKAKQAAEDAAAAIPVVADSVAANKKDADSAVKDAQAQAKAASDARAVAVKAVANIERHTEKVDVIKEAVADIQKSLNGGLDERILAAVKPGLDKLESRIEEIIKNCTAANCNNLQAKNQGIGER